MSDYNDVNLFIDGNWIAPEAGKMLVVINPATGEPAGKVAHAERADLDRALEAAEKGFAVWRKVNSYERSKIMRKAANLLRERAASIAVGAKSAITRSGWARSTISRQPRRSGVSMSAEM